MKALVGFAATAPLPRLAPHLRQEKHRPGRLADSFAPFRTRRLVNCPSSQPCRRDRNAHAVRMDAGAESGVHYNVELCSSITAFDADVWNSLARQGSECPFLEHDWLRCLEESGSASPETGWAPRHLAVRSAAGSLLAVVPAYIKSHSLGEFVFDSAFAEAAYAMGVDYYPKLLVGVPFTPATGRRILTVDDGARSTLIQVAAAALLQLCKELELSSIHVNFCEADEASAFEQVGYMRRIGAQFHWQNARQCEDGSTDQYRDFSDFLNSFNSKRRIKLRRERAKVREAGIGIRILHGDLVTPQSVEDMFPVYKAGIDKHVYWGRQYLNKEFFRLLGQATSFHKHLLFVLAEDERERSVVAGTFNVIGGSNNRTFYGRYWGAPAQVCGEKQVPFLHFETCYYSAIETAINLGLARFEPGAGGGDSKHPRGFAASPTFSVHWFANRSLSRAVQRYMHMERAHISSEIAEMQ